MARTVAIGIQNFEDYIKGDYFYIDKSEFIGAWWKSGDNTTAIMRPRRFGKTLTMDMVKTFFSLDYKDKGEAIFGGLEIWQDEEMRALQGTYPVIFISFADIKKTSYKAFESKMKELFSQLYEENNYLLDGDMLSDDQKKYFKDVRAKLDNVDYSGAVKRLSEFKAKYHGKRVIIILDEYDTPMMEAYVSGYWTEAVEFLRGFFNSTFKTNPYMERALMTGITRISKESVFSDFNHVRVITMRSNMYAESFGFTEDEVFSSLDEYRLGEEKENVKKWYDGFIIGDKKDIYNPWSIVSFLQNKGEYAPYWANSSSNSLINTIVKNSSTKVKQMMQELLEEKNVKIELDEEIVYDVLNGSPNSVFSMLFTSGYVTGARVEPIDIEKNEYYLHLTNREILRMFRKMISGWFNDEDCNYNDFVDALLKGELKAMNVYMNRVALATFSYFDTGKGPSAYNEPERFYHGFVLGLIVDLRNEYIITSNRESGFGRYDVLMEPKDISKHDAIILEFKVHDSEDEKDLKETVASAIQQINDMNYAASLVEKGIPAERIRKYGFAFEGKKVLIGC